MSLLCPIWKLQKEKSFSFIIPDKGRVVSKAQWLSCCPDRWKRKNSKINWIIFFSHSLGFQALGCPFPTCQMSFPKKVLLQCAKGSYKMNSGDQGKLQQESTIELTFKNRRILTEIGVLVISLFQGSAFPAQTVLINTPFL